MNARMRIAAAAGLIEVAAAAPAALAKDQSGEAYEKLGDVITKAKVRHDLFGGTAGPLEMTVVKGKKVCVAKPNGSIKAAKKGDCKIRFVLTPATGKVQRVTILLHVTKSGQSPEGSG